MAIAYDNSTEGANSEQSSITISGFTVSGSNRFLLVGVVWGTNQGVTLTSVTFNGDSLTRLSSSKVTNSTLNVEIFYMVAPDAATGDIVVTMSGATRVNAVGAVSLTGVSQSDPIGQQATGQNTLQSTINTNITTEADNSWVLDVVGTAKNASTNPGTADSPQVERWDVEDTYFVFGDVVYASYGSHETTTAEGTYNLGWTTSVNTNHVHSLVEILANVITNTFTVDGIVQETKTKTFTVDGIVLAETTKTFTVDGLIATRTTNTFTVDGIIAETKTNTFTADGVVQETLTETFTADGVVIAQVQATFTVDLIVDLGPYRYRLGSQILPRPNRMYREKVYKRTEYNCMDGSTKRDLSSIKEEIVLEYDNLGEDTMTQILLEIDTNAPVLFEVAEETFTINQTNVIPLVLRREYNKGGSYYQAIELRLTQIQ